jgi:hypothetical protein
MTDPSDAVSAKLQWMRTGKRDGAIPRPNQEWILGYYRVSVFGAVLVLPTLLGYAQYQAPQISRWQS